MRYRVRPGAPQGRGSHVDERTNPAPVTPLGRSGGPDGLSGHLRATPGSILETCWNLLGSLGSTFRENRINILETKSRSSQLQIEKTTRGTLQLAEIHDACRVKSDLGRKPAADPSREGALRLPQRNVRCAAKSLQILLRARRTRARAFRNPPTQGAAWR